MNNTVSHVHLKLVCTSMSSHEPHESSSDVSEVGRLASISATCVRKHSMLVIGAFHLRLARRNISVTIGIFPWSTHDAQRV